MAYATLAEYAATGAVPYVVRRHVEVIQFFDGLELVEPGLVPINEWQPTPPLADVEPIIQAAVSDYGGLAKKH